MNHHQRLVKLPRFTHLLGIEVPKSRLRVLEAGKQQRFSRTYLNKLTVALRAESVQADAFRSTPLRSNQSSEGATENYHGGLR